MRMPLDKSSSSSPVSSVGLSLPVLPSCLRARLPVSVHACHGVVVVHVGL